MSMIISLANPMLLDQGKAVPVLGFPVQTALAIFILVVFSSLCTRPPAPDY
jgi:hypothetical protein